MTCVRDDGIVSTVVSIVESGCALDDSRRQAFGDVLFNHGYYPHKIHLQIEHDSVTLLDQAFTANYTISQPNGPHCEPICCHAHDKVLLSFGGPPVTEVHQ